jgi:hypothetical protein
MTWGQSLVIIGVLLGWVAVALAGGWWQRRERRRDRALELDILRHADWRNSIDRRYLTPRGRTRRGVDPTPPRKDP